MAPTALTRSETSGMAWLPRNSSVPPAWFIPRGPSFDSDHERPRGHRENVTTSGFFMEPEPSPGGLNVTAGEAITIVIGCLVVLGSSISLLRYALVSPGRISLNSAALGATPRAVCLVADLFASSSSWRRKQQQQRRAVLVDGGKPAAGAGGGDDLVAVNVPDIRRP
ncbi:unnamed protein product [Lampetra planeri]